MAEEFDFSGPSYGGKKDAVGFGENFMMSAAQSFREGNVPLMTFDTDTEEALRKQMFDDAESQYMPKDEFNFLASMDIGEAIEYINTQTELSGYPTTEDLWANVKAENERKLEEDNAMREQSGALGDTGYWAAQMLTPLLSPVNWPGMYYGTLGASSFAQAFLRVGTLETATQLVSQPIIADQKEQAGIKYGKGDMFINGLLTVAAASTLSAATTIKLRDIAPEWLDKFNRRAYEVDMESTVAADVDLIHAGKEMVPEASATEFINDVASVSKGRDARPPVKVDDLKPVEEVLPEVKAEAGAAPQRRGAETPEADELAGLESRQKQERLDELKAKDSLDEIETDEVELLTKELGEAPEVDPMVVKHAEEAAPAIKEADDALDTLQKLTDCTL